MITICASKDEPGWDAVHHADRLTTPKMRVGGELVTAPGDEARSRSSKNLKVIKNKRGADGIGGLGSVRTTNEDNYAFQKFMMVTGRTHRPARASQNTEGDQCIFFQANSAGSARATSFLCSIRTPATSTADRHRDRAGGKQAREQLISVRRRTEQVQEHCIRGHPQDTGSARFLTAGLRSARRIVSARVSRLSNCSHPPGSGPYTAPPRLRPTRSPSYGNFAGYPETGSILSPRHAGQHTGSDGHGVLPDYFPGYQAVSPETAASGESAGTPPFRKRGG